MQHSKIRKSLLVQLSAPGVTEFVEVHSALSAILAEEANYGALWASGLALSLSLGVRDRNEASWSQLVDILEFITDATSLPVLMDGDNGFGDFNNAQRLVKKLCQRNVAGVCLEEKTFPKANSLRENNSELEIPEIFARKIAACKDAQLSDEFVVVARVEALVSGLEQAEALRRAELYHQAGADAVVIHSKQSHAGQVLEFARSWGGRCPLIVIPTTYFGTSVDVYRDAGIQGVIWANHSIRASISAMRDVYRALKAEDTRIQYEGSLPRVAELFDLVGQDALDKAEKLYG